MAFFWILTGFIGFPISFYVCLDVLKFSIFALAIVI